MREKAEMKEVYRFLVNKYHPDKLEQRDDLTPEQKEEQKKMFKIIAEKYSDNDIEFLENMQRVIFHL